MTELIAQQIPAAFCQPYDQVIELPNKKSNVDLFPSCIVIKQCGGCCGRDWTCRPTETKDVLVEVSLYIILFRPRISNEYFNKFCNRNRYLNLIWTINLFYTNFLLLGFQIFNFFALFCYVLRKKAYYDNKALAESFI